MFNFLNHIKNNDIDSICNHPETIPECFQCREPKRIYDTVGSHRLPFCRDCFTSLERCNYCSRKTIDLNNGICNNCLSNSAHVMSYGDKPSPLFHRVNNRRIDKPPLLSSRDYARKTDGKRQYLDHFGVEVETDSKRNSDDSIKHTDNKLASLVHIIGRGSTTKEQLLYCKEDSTCFVEIVSHPFSWNYWLKYGQEVFKTLFLKLRENNLAGYDTHDSGMHIHASRKAIGSLNLVKIMHLIHNDDNYQFILEISQRNRERLHDWGRVGLDGDSWANLSSLCSMVDYAQNTIGRSVAVNLHNRATVEFRIFRGTLNYNTFCKNLEFVKSVIDWSRCTSLDTAKHHSLESYLAHLKKHANNYENLCFFLAKRNYTGFKVIQDRWTRKYMTELNQLSFNSDSKELF